MTAFRFFALMLAVASVRVMGQDLYTADGTPIELREGEKVYITDKPVFTITELEPFVSNIDDTLDSFEEYSEAWCSFWLKNVYDGAPTFENQDIIDRCALVGVEPQ